MAQKSSTFSSHLWCPWGEGREAFAATTFYFNDPILYLMLIQLGGGGGLVIFPGALFTAKCAAPPLRPSGKPSGCVEVAALAFPREAGKEPRERLGSPGRLHADAESLFVTIQVAGSSRDPRRTPALCPSHALWRPGPRVPAAAAGDRPRHGSRGLHTSPGASVDERSDAWGSARGRMRCGRDPSPGSSPRRAPRRARFALCRV